MESALKVASGSHQGKIIKIPQSKFMIGRSEDCQLRPSSDLISRQHCLITVLENSAKIEDLGSRNGTYLNGEKLTGPSELKAGDKISVGQLAFEFCVLKAKDSGAMPTVTKPQSSST